MNNIELKKSLSNQIETRNIAIPETTGQFDSEHTEYIALVNNALELIHENLKTQSLSFQLFDTDCVNCREC